MKLTNFLLDISHKITDIEIEAKASLSNDSNDHYKKLMHEKALLLSSLYEEAKKQDVSDIKNSDKILSRIKEFSDSADDSLVVNSPWFMSALLYPDDYMEGDLNNLQKLIEEIEYK